MKILLAASLIMLTLGIADSQADERIASKHALTLEGAKKIGEAAAAYARANGASPSIAIVDEGGHLLYFTRSEDSFAAGASVSIGKAHTAAVFKKATKDFHDGST